MSGSITKNQHIVPQFLQKNFSDNNKQVNIFRISESNITHTLGTISKNMSQSYFYGKNQDVEKALGNFETKSAPIINKIINQDFDISLEDEVTLRAFIFCQFLRQYSFIDEIHHFFKEGYEATNEEKAKTALSMILRPNIISDLSSFDLYILENKTRTPFILGANPAFVSSFYIEKPKITREEFKKLGVKELYFGMVGTRLAGPDTYIYLPVSPNFSFILVKKAYQIVNSQHLRDGLYYVKIQKDKTIKVFNKTQIYNAKRTIITSHKGLDKIKEYFFSVKKLRRIKEEKIKQKLDLPFFNCFLPDLSNFAKKR